MLRRICRESYSDPRTVYQTLKHRGMDLVTVTDHDSIDAGECLRRYPDFFLSEEVSATSPSGTEMHIGVYDIQERHHIEVQRRREDLLSLIAYLDEQQIFFTINHVYSSLTGRRTESDFELFSRHFPGVEALNGQIPALCNRRAADLALRQRKAVVGGSDAHTTAALGHTYTQVPGARTKSEFMERLRRGQASLHGESGSYWKLTRAVLKLGSEMMRERPWTLSLLPLAFAVPLITLANAFREFAFVHRWARGGTCAPRQPAVLGYEEAGL
ncbi:MAG: PHP domain-containing protein [Acidobacteriia bacterium]|nr:PHP domain-containing protein [Terriglobia bacterium]